VFSPFLSGLADAATGKKFWHIPYRESVLTKLLQSALGGNSKTTLVQAVFHTAPGAIVTLRGPAIPTSPPCHLPATVLTLAFAQSSSFSTRSVHCCLLCFYLVTLGVDLGASHVLGKRHPEPGMDTTFSIRTNLVPSRAEHGKCRVILNRPPGQGSGWKSVGLRGRRDTWHPERSQACVADPRPLCVCHMGAWRSKRGSLLPSCRDGLRGELCPLPKLTGNTSLLFTP
jgi:hypothetical protein